MTPFLDKLRRLLRRTPAGIRWLSYLLPRYRKLAVNSETEIVIEGYPRCANTFSVVAFTQSQPREVKVAHHIHSVAQIRRGVQLGIPTVVLLRNPEDAILSLAIRLGHKSPAWATAEYVDFHQGVDELGDSVLLVDFEEITSDFGAVIRRINERFGTEFSEFEHTDENIARCYEVIDSFEKCDASGGKLRATHVARPSTARHREKESLAALLASEELVPTLKEAERLYSALSARRLRSIRGQLTND